jgi:hypothetical protein
VKLITRTDSAYLTISDDSSISYDPNTQKNNGLGLKRTSLELDAQGGTFEIRQNLKQGMVHEIKL